MSRILVLGAGFVAGPLVGYLSKRQHQITVASQFLDEAQAIADDYPEISISEVNVTDAGSLGTLVAGHDLTISFVPCQFHINVAKQCIKYGKHMVTASYETAEIKALHQQAVEQNIIILNEIGLDPGIDHLSAMQIIDSIHQHGGKLLSFISWCGGLPAPDSNNNPLGYKFSWAPKNVLMALLYEAIYLKQGKVVTIPADQLLQHVQPVKVSATLLLEGYPNRDSLSYQDCYGINEATTILRGTLRYPGFSAIMQCCKEMCLFETSQDLTISSAVNWQTLLRQKVTDLDSLLAKQPLEIKETLQWLGLLDAQQMVATATSMIDAFCQLLIEKLSYGDDEKDMIVLQHQFISINTKGEIESRQSTLIMEGDVNGFSAMAKTVGTPAAIAADLIVSGNIDNRGVILPMCKNIYNPLLQALRDEGICLEETMKVEKAAEFSTNV